MSRNRKTTSVSRIERPRPVPYARRVKTGGEIVEDAGEPVTTTDNDTTKAGTTSPETTADTAKPDGAKLEKHAQKSAAQPNIKADDDAARTADQAADPTGKRRPHSSTIEMPVNTLVGQPPAIPPVVNPPAPATASSAPASEATPVIAAAKPGDVEDPTFMPHPRYIPAGNPADPAPPPGLVPPGDSRSFRRRDAAGESFALIYRVGTFVISRFGTVGTRGQWRVVEYPTSSSASHSYAKECSRFVTEGFSDYRD